MLTIKYTNLRGGIAPRRASTCISLGKGGGDLKLSTARAHHPIRIFIPQSLQLHAPLTVMPTNPFTTFTFATAADATLLRGGRYRWTERKPPILIFLPQILQLHAPLTVMPTSPLHAGHLYLHHRCYQSPRLLVKLEAYDSASKNHQYSMYFLGKVDGA